MGESDWQIEELIVMQTDLDDESPEILGHVLTKLMDAGALDAHLSPLLMKKGRPGTRLEVLCREPYRQDLLRLIFRETSTFGVKTRKVERYALQRREEIIQTHGANIRVKIAMLDGDVLRAVPEFEDCRVVSENEKRPLREVMEHARAEALRLLDRKS